MEGRAIARPNGGARSGPCGGAQAASMEGRAIARPNLPPNPSRVVGHSASMEGRAIARPNSQPSSACIRAPASLQWRAGQLPGQTGTRGCDDPPRHGFNGGPGNCPAKPARAWACRPRPACFNGGPGNCPAKPDAAQIRSVAARRASMEGRAIARPNSARSRPAQKSRSCFNGGPGNCPAKHRRAQWRTGAGEPASMEGRAIARPNLHDDAVGPPLVRLQWRAGQLPGQTVRAAAMAPSSALLQWRAGQLPGQTGDAAGGGWGDGQASMEGRAIARPNASNRRQSSGVPRCFNGGPGNCPAKPGTDSHRPDGLSSLQ